MDKILNENDFQKWVMARLEATGAHVVDLSAVGGSVPDLSAASGLEYWLELKYGAFKLLHSKYDRFYYHETKRLQLEWLRKRQLAAPEAVCGILGYALMRGDYGEGTPYLTFHTAGVYLEEIWYRTKDAGALVLSHHAQSAHSVRSGKALLDFINDARPREPRKR